MAYIGKAPNTAIVNQATSQSFSGNGSTTAFTLTRSVNVGEDLEVFVNNVQQEPGSGKSYTASGTTLTFDEAPPSGTNNVYVIYRGEATINPRLEHDANNPLAATTGTFSGAVTFDGGANFGDNDKAIFGAGSDLQIYHDGSDSYILDTGTGGLYLKANADFYVQSRGTDETFIQAASNAFVKLFFNGSEKLATTSTGIDVTGTVTADGLTVDGGANALTRTSSGAEVNALELRNNATATDTATTLKFANSTAAGSNSGSTELVGIRTGTNTGDFVVRVADSTPTMQERLRITSGGSVGIGTSAPESNLHILSSNTTTYSASSADGQEGDGSTLKIESTPTAMHNFGQILFTMNNNRVVNRIVSSFTSTIEGYLAFVTETSGTPTEAMRIVGGKVGIGTSSPSVDLEIASTAGSLQLTDTDGTEQNTILKQSGGSFFVQARDGSSNAPIVFGGNGGGTFDEHMRINAGGQIGINTSSPNGNALLHVSGTGNPSASMGVKGIMLSYSSGNSAPIYFGTETNASAKAIYMKDFYMTIRGHDNEGVKFDGSGSNVTRYRFDMGNAGNDCFNASNSANWNTTSDSRIKENVQSLPDGSIAKIKALRPVTFDYTDDWATQKGWFNYTAPDDDPHDISENGFNLDQKNNDIGWIAQEYETVFPQDVHDKTETVNGQEVTDFKTMKPDSLLPHLVKALQEAIAKIETLETKVAALEGN